MFAALIIVVGGFDVISTDVALAAGSVEANPLIGTLQTHFGGWWFAPKILLHVLFAYFVLWLPSKKMLRISGIVVAVY
ncbi:MAG: DUF5658 family protein, partial [Gammaproteobacteria bacterium]